ncbi:Uncharacterised protein [Segatella copri]|nr:Uncharacterised protein [Segatella copri]
MKLERVDHTELSHKRLISEREVEYCEACSFIELTTIAFIWSGATGASTPVISRYLNP